jgi:hypothetical protein
MEMFIFSSKEKNFYLYCNTLNSNSFNLALKNLTKRLNQNVHKKIILQNQIIF